MRVSLILDLVNRLGRGRKAAERDLAGVRRAAESIGSKPGPIIQRLDQIGPAAGKAARELRGTKRAADALGTSAGAAKVARDTDRAAEATRRLKREVEAISKARQSLAQTSAGGLPARDSRGRFVGGTGGTSGGSAAAGLGAAALAKSRDALMPLAAAYGGYRGVSAGVRGTVGSAVSREKAMAEVKKKVELPQGADWDGLEKEIAKMAITYGRRFDEIAAIVAEAGANNIEWPEMTGFTRLATRAAIGWDMDLREAAEKLFQIRVQRQASLAELEQFADMVNDQEDNSAAKARDIIDMVQRASEAGETAGVDFKAATAFLAAVRSGGMQPEVAARMFAAFTGGLRGISEGSEKAKAALAQLGLEADAVEKGMKTDAVATIVDLFDKLSRHGDQAKVAMQLFGKEWWDDVLRARKVMPEFLRLLERTKNPKTYTGSLDKALNVELNTTDRHLKSIREAAESIGNHLGKWALPPIKDAITGMLAGLDELDRRAAEKQKAKDAVASEDATAGKIAGGTPLTPEERDRMARDGAYRRRIETRAEDKRMDKANLALSDGLRLGELETERERLARSIETRRQAGATDDQLAYSARRLGEIVDAIQQIDPQRAPPSHRLDPRRPADQDDRAAGIERAEVLALQERVRLIQERYDTLARFAATMPLQADRQGFGGDAAREKMRLDDARQRLAFAQAGVSEWAEKIRGGFEIDLGPAGMTMAERLAAGIRSGASQPESAARSVSDGIAGTFNGAEFSGAGTTMMDGLAAGIRNGGVKAIAEAQRVAREIEATIGGVRTGRSRAVSGALHDGVD